jgi:hypothetical protein
LYHSQRHPEQYDGLLTGAPAFNWNRFIPAELWGHKQARDITYHGTADLLIFSRGSIHYFERLHKKYGADNVNKFARLFMVPGMSHCAFGGGPNAAVSLSRAGVSAAGQVHREWQFCRRWKLVMRGGATQAADAVLPDQGSQNQQGNQQ